MTAITIPEDADGRLAGLPDEVLVHIYHSADLSTLVSLSKVAVLSMTW